jgi:hypothetical protein
VTRIGELETTQAATSNRRKLRRNTNTWYLVFHRFLSPWWRRRQVPPKRRFLQEPNGVTSQKTPFFIVTAVKTSNLTQCFSCLRSAFHSANLIIFYTEQMSRNPILSNCIHLYFTCPPLVKHFDFKTKAYIAHRMRDQDSESHWNMKTWISVPLHSNGEYDLRRMVSSGLLRRAALVRTDVSEVASCSLCCTSFADFCPPDEGGARYLRNVGSYKSHTA